jgi:HNH endonuclease
VGGQRPQVGVLLFPQALSPKTLARLAEVHREGAAGRRFEQLLIDPDRVDWTRPGVLVDQHDTPIRLAGRTREDMLRDLRAAAAMSGSSRELDGDTSTHIGDSAGETQRQSWATQAGAVPDREPQASEPAARSAQTAAASVETTNTTTNAVPDPSGGSPVWAPTWSRSGWADPPWLDWVGPVPPAVAQRIACDADIWRVVLDPASGMPLDVGRAYRLVPYWIRRALYARDRGCRWPGCTTPAQWTDAHHIHPWAESGETKVEDCVLLCRYHHGLVHEGGWHIALAPDTGEVHITRPEGIPYLVPYTRSTSWNGPATQTG